jgi:hypothetical protein
VGKVAVFLVIEHVRVDVDPEATVATGIAREVGDGIAGGHVHAAAANPTEIDRAQLRRERLTSVRGLLLSITETERDDVVIVHQRPATFDVRQEVGTTARGERQLH